MTELGNRLKEARLAKGLSLDDLQTITKIQKRYLVGIEEGNYAFLPGNFYVRAFIKQYSEAVELDPDEIFETYKNEIPATHNEDLPEQLSRTQTTRTFSERSPKLFDLVPKLLIAVVVIGAAVLIYFFLQHTAKTNTNDSMNSQSAPVNFQKSKNLDNAQPGNTSTSKSSSSKGNSTAKPQVQQPATQTISVAKSSGYKTTYQVKNAAKFIVKVVSKGQTWISISDSKGVSRFQGLLQNGQSSKPVDLSTDTGALIVVGNATATDIYVNDQKINYAISPSQIVRQDITIQYVPKNK